MKGKKHAIQPDVLLIHVFGTLIPYEHKVNLTMNWNLKFLKLNPYDYCTKAATAQYQWEYGVAPIDVF